MPSDFNISIHEHQSGIKIVISMRVGEGLVESESVGRRVISLYFPHFSLGTVVVGGRQHDFFIHFPIDWLVKCDYLGACCEVAPCCFISGSLLPLDVHLAL